MRKEDLNETLRDIFKRDFYYLSYMMSVISMIIGTRRSRETVT